MNGDARSSARRTAAEAFYGALAAHPDGARRVGWESRAAHVMRQRAIVEALAPVTALTSVLDAGCGEGALLATLREAGFTGRYRGEDVLGAPIVRAREAAPADEGAAFAVVDSLAGGLVDGPATPRPSAQAVVCSGTLNTDSGAPDHDVEVAAALTALWARAEELLVVDLAVSDRHAPGVGLARADLSRAWAHARSLAPVVVVREDVIAGEALLVLSRGRARAFARRLEDPVLVAQALLQAGEAGAALSCCEGASGAELSLARGQALAALGRMGEALEVLRVAAVRARDEGREAVGDAARLAQAPVLWRMGDRRAAEGILTELAERSDEARAHLFELLVARKEIDRARALALRIEDAWVRRELEARLPRR